MKTILFEMLMVLLMVKPALDAKRVASGNIMLEDSCGDPAEELTLMKIIEMFAESLPSSVLQTYAVFKNDDYSAAAISSIAVSAMTISFVSTTMSVVSTN